MINKTILYIDDFPLKDGPVSKGQGNITISLAPETLSENRDWMAYKTN